MSEIFIHGLGAVSPAGWGIPALREALDRTEPLPVQVLDRPGWAKKLSVRGVPPPLARPACFAHPRLRRAGALSQYTVTAALEALGEDAAAVTSGALRLGIIVCTLAGGISYTRRFYEEVLRDPGTSSPLIFPETVFNAPASHLAAYLNSSILNYTLVGDDGTVLQALALAAGWLEDDRADACLVVGVEEMDWAVSDAARLFSRSIVYASGAGALYLKKNSAAPVGLSAVTDSMPFTETQNRSAAASRMCAQLGGAPDELLCDSESGPTTDWLGRRLRLKHIMGEAFAATAAWQCVAACDSIQQNQFFSAVVRVVGINQQAIGARFVKIKNP